MKNRKTFSAILVSVLILAGWYLLFGARTSKVVVLKFTDTHMTAYGPEEFLWQCDLADISDLELVDSIDSGICISGSDTKDYRIGKWQNPLWGDYQICAAKSIPSFVVVTTQSQGIFVFNYETSANTKILYDSFIKMLED